MQRLRTVLLRHARRGDTHLDWMFETPGPTAETAELTTFRVASPWNAWPKLGHITVTPLTPHRRAYLTRQGPLTGNRGSVTRVATGYVEVADWHANGGSLVLLPTPPGAPPMRIAIHNAASQSASLHVTQLGPAAGKR